MESIERWPDRMSAAASSPNSEEISRLDQAMAKADELLLASLKQDESRRRKRRRIQTGVSIMLATVAVVFVLIASKQHLPNASPSPTMPMSASAQDANQLMIKGWQLWQHQQYADATSAFQNAVEINPRLTNAWNGLGWSKFNGGDQDGAIDAFKHVLILQPDHPAALNGLGQVYFQKGDLKNAEKYLLRAAPQAPAAWFGLAKIYLLENKWPQAAEYAHKIIDSGQVAGPDLAYLKRMLQAAQKQKLPDDLKALIAPATYMNASTQPAQP